MAAGAPPAGAGAALTGWPAPDGAPLVLKPALGDGARNIALVRTLAEAYGADPVGLGYVASDCGCQMS